MAFVGSIIAAAAFTAGSALYDQFIKKPEADEIRKAQEKLAADNLEYSRNKQATLEFLNYELKLHQDAMSNFNDVDAALERYNELFPEKKLDVLALQGPKQPKLSDYYTPSDQKIHTEYGLMIASGLIAGYIVYKYI